jgi:hypothetical protein
LQGEGIEMENMKDVSFSSEINEKMTAINKIKNEINQLNQSIQRLELYQSQPGGFDAFCPGYQRKVLDHLNDFFKKEEEALDEKICLMKTKISALTEDFKQDMQAEKEKAESILASIMSDIEQEGESSKADMSQQSVDDHELEKLVEELKARKGNKEIDKPVNTDAPIESKSAENDPNPDDVTSKKMSEGFWNDIPIIHQEIEEVEKEEVPVLPVRESKHNFVIGKVAGENLFDRSGKLIIAQDEIISEDVVTKAESEGKLVELIINMKLA